jgi:serine/threonine protein kinase/tetratricopeptide (TPR) repeat protein
LNIVTESSSLPQHAEPVAALLPNSSLVDQYIIERELGHGGMATVYLAEERKHGRQVAVKVLRPELSATFGADRFLREIAIVARLSHPHLVPLIDSGEADGMLYYVSVYIPGGSLRDRLRREGRLSIQDAIRIIHEVGDGLDFANRAGFVHRDVKPENILFADGHALLADFGIARAFCEEDDDLESVTAAGITLGTPEYMSPEQASGERTLSVRSDVYSLACVFYEMLTGEPPHRGTSARATMAKHVTETPRRVRTLRSEVPVPIDDAIARALASDPELRFATVAEFCAALVTDVAPRGYIAASVTRSIAVLPFVNASPDPDNEYLSDGITDELIDALAKVEGIHVASRTSVFALKGKLQDVRAIGSLLDCSVVLEGTVRRSGSQLRITAQLTSTSDGRLLWSQRYDRRLDDVFAIQDEIARTIVDTLRATWFADLAPAPVQHYTDNVRAYGLYLKGRYEWNRRTQEGVTAGIRYFEQAIAVDPSYALAYTGLADCYALHVDYRSVPVDEGFAQAKKYALQAIALNDSLAEAHASLAWCRFAYDWDWAAAGQEFRRAIELDPRYATAHQWYAFLLSALGATGESLVEGHTAIELDPGSVSARRSLGWAYLYARRYEQARYHLERAITMNPNAEETFRVLGVTLSLEGKHADAERVLRETAAMPGAGTYTSASLGYALARAGKRDEALALLAELESHAAVGYVSPVAFATILLGLGDVDRAIDWAERAYDDRRGWLAYVNVNPLMDPMRGHPRFEALARRMNL